MKDSFIMAPGYPYELLGLLRRMPGIEDINLLLDSDKLSKTFRKNYPDYKICGEIMDEACRLGIISEMAGIINGPMWRKRSFINKSAIRIMAEGRLKEYQMCELLESMMQLFEWDFELQIMRRWSTSEEDSADYNKEHPRVTEGHPDEKTNEGKERLGGRRYIRDGRKESVREETRDSGEEETQEFESENTFEPKSRKKYGNTSRGRRMGAERRVADGNPKNEGRPTAADMGEERNVKHARMHVNKRKKRVITVKYDYIDNNGMVTDIKGYIQNEIIKSGIRFENIMNNSVKRDVRSAIKGNADAQYRMGAYYAEPDTKHTDYEEALKWYRVSASQGNKKAQFEIGMLYDGGKIKCTDYKKEAIKCYLALAEAGFPTAQCKLGMKYRLGDGVEEDINEAIKWFKRAATQGHTDAQRNLGDVYMAIHRIDEAMRWYERAAAAGDSFSARQIGKGKA